MEIEQVEDVLSEYPDIFGDKTFILLNKAFPETDRLSDEKQRELIDRLSADIKHPVIGMIPCYCEVLKTRRRLLVLEKPRHSFVSDLEETAQKLIGDYEKYGEEIRQVERPIHGMRGSLQGLIVLQHSLSLFLLFCQL